MMEIRLLRYFIAVANQQSISGAAKYLHVSQPSLSRQLSEFERNWALLYLSEETEKSP